MTVTRLHNATRRDRPLTGECDDCKGHGRPTLGATETYVIPFHGQFELCPRSVEELRNA